MRILCAGHNEARAARKRAESSEGWVWVGSMRLSRRRRGVGTARGQGVLEWSVAQGEAWA